MADQLKLDSMDIVLSFNGESRRARVQAPGPNNVQSYLFNLENYQTEGDIENVHAGIAPIFIVNNKKRIGGIVSELDLSKKSIPTSVEDTITEGEIQVRQRPYRMARRSSNRGGKRAGQSPPKVALFSKVSLETKRIPYSTQLNRK
jgi:hypothetical protein